ncbi:amidohydrolase family protein [uncultured Amnibacterium sp.]|uniref:amidohydrolase family protein n=1 Tax=uncultured Amnibacterium sp. TaxID=1631851 RepID=UPI0035CBF913
MRTDFHSHLYAKPFLDLMIELGREDYRRAPAQDLDPSQRIAAMDSAGIDRQVMSFIGLNTVVDDAGGAVAAAQTLNDTYAEVGARSLGRLQSFALLPLPYVEQAISEARRAMAAPDCIGVGVACSISGRPLDDPQFDPLWSELDGLGAVVFVHPVGGDSAGHWGMAEWGMTAMFGSPMQLAIAACRLVFGGTLARFPNLRFLFAQGGGFLASRWEAIENTVLRPGLAGHAPYILGWVRDLDIDANDPMAGFRSLWFDTATMHQSPTLLDSARATFGLDRLVLGSDALFGSLVDTVAFVERTDRLSDAERASILEGGAVPLVQP